MENIEQEITKINERNKKVEAEKAREKSSERKVFIILITYLFMCFFMNLISVEKVWINAIIPTFCFLLSTLYFDFLKKQYREKFYKKGGG